MQVAFLPLGWLSSRPQQPASGEAVHALRGSGSAVRPSLACRFAAPIVRCSYRPMVDMAMSPINQGRPRKMTWGFPWSRRRRGPGRRGAAGARTARLAPSA